MKIKKLIPKLIPIFFVTILLFAASGQTEKKVNVEYFYGSTCPKCIKAGPIIDSVISYYGERVNFTKHNIITDEGFVAGEKYKIPGIPYVVINGSTFIAYDDYNGNLLKLETLLREAIDTVVGMTPETPITVETISSKKEEQSLMEGAIAIIALIVLIVYISRKK